ncbi:TIGR04282 family arsenosugar biosynthesis glycosyltransferase [Desulfonatronospira sp.]|uniref:TIGR04282 family arsenosugar biosynthesis glycosyltransferase n=1 Tax=Desulfonatronospira sp. TaxID=1962951 RepID=UPI0025BB1037|nr:TIGR04282 family arsenosugar biosynthesis glycosyltransferase [Desulfonatronospira sp.]
MDDKGCLIIMVKFPEPGKVKTRLGREIGMSRAAGIYSRFVLEMLAKCRQINFFSLLSCHPDRPARDYHDWLGNNYSLIVQNGSDLGSIMHNSFEQVFELGFSRVILTGSDIPHLPVSYIQTAFSRLKDHDLVIGPALDGGYFLLGANKGSFIPEIFKNIPWSTPAVYSLTMEKIHENNLKCFVLPTLRDIDTLDDLKDFYSARGQSLNNTPP